MRGIAKNRYTRYDAMEAAGIFASNPANADAGSDDEGNSLYRGPVEFPKMLYHPEGETRVIVAAQAVTTASGEAQLDRFGNPVMRGEQREIIFVLVKSEEEEQRMLDLGWHDHPAKAIAAGGGEAPPVSSAARIDDLESQLAKLQAELARAKGGGEVKKSKASAAANELLT